ncbi:MAG: thioredoxin domain-containing protein [Deltaproteobacteria bacterium]|jgi:protein-disulfide isomerase|nr:thioredoxin domain-containing protein [Deltaproteobacteria bacterium]
MKQKALFITAAVILLAAFAVGAWIYKGGETGEPVQAADPVYSQLIRMHSPTLGKPDAKVQLVEFIDPACEACAGFYPLVKQIIAIDPDEIRLVMRYAPFHKGASAVVAVLEAAKKQDKFWPALEALLAAQSDWTQHHTAQVNRVWKHLEGLGLDLEQVREDMGSPQIARAVAQDLADAKALGVNKTPSFFVNGQPLTNFGYAPLKAMVEQALAASNP